MVGDVATVAAHSAGAAAERWVGGDVDARPAFGGRDAANLHLPPCSAEQIRRGISFER
jgi:hypothetical protein